MYFLFNYFYTGTIMTQSDALSILKMGKNVFLTGGAGTGKTYVLNQYIQYCYDHEIPIAVTASTGIAATHIGGMTIHAWSGIGIKETLFDYEIEMMDEKKYLWDRYQKVRVLVIDEISMLSGIFLDTLDRLCRSMKRNHHQPFGGIQVVLCGDLFQLPPVSRTNDVQLVIDSSVWNKMNLTTCYLTEQFRQNDDFFTEILNAIRANIITPEHIETLYDRVREYDESDFNGITKLFTHNADVDQINFQQLENISDDEYLYEMTSKGKANLVETLKKSCLAPAVLKLKIGAQVMFVKNNFEAGYVNGTRGEVIDINNDELPVVKTLTGREIVVNQETWAIDDNGKILASISQIPLRHAWAITVHKSQGMSLDAAVIDLSKSFAYGMGYVALSRVRTLQGLHLVGFSENSLLVDPRILAVDQKLQTSSELFTQKLCELSESEIAKRHKDFILVSGGKIEISKKKKKQEKISTRKTHEITYDLLVAGNTLPEIMRERGLQLGTVIEHLQKNKDSGKSLRDFPHISIDFDLVSRVRDAYDAVKNKGESIFDVKLTPVKRYLEQSGYDDGFDAIKFARLFIDE
jgi:hypothetical protein